MENRNYYEAPKANPHIEESDQNSRSFPVLRMVIAFLAFLLIFFFLEAIFVMALFFSINEPEATFNSVVGVISLFLALSSPILSSALLANHWGKVSMYWPSILAGYALVTAGLAGGTHPFWFFLMTSTSFTLFFAMGFALGLLIKRRLAKNHS